MATTEPFVTETTLKVRYVETDAMGIVHHGSYIVYLEVGRVDYAEQRGYPYADLERDGFNIAVAEVNLRYAKIVRFGQTLTVRCWIVDMKSRSMTFEYEILDEAGDVCATATTKHICVNRDGQVKRIPASWAAWKTG